MTAFALGVAFDTPVPIGLKASGDVKYSPGAKLVFLAIADSANADDWTTWLKVETIAEKTHLDTRTVQSHIALLRRLGLVSRQRNAYAGRAGNIPAGRRPNLWQVFPNHPDRPGDRLVDDGEDLGDNDVDPRLIDIVGGGVKKTAPHPGPEGCEKPPPWGEKNRPRGVRKTAPSTPSSTPSSTNNPSCASDDARAAGGEDDEPDHELEPGTVTSLFGDQQPARRRKASPRDYSSHPRFVSWWTAWRVKTGKAAAFRAWKESDQALVEQATGNYHRAIDAHNARHPDSPAPVMMAATFINGGMDDYADSAEPNPMWPTEARPAANQSGGAEHPAAEDYRAAKRAYLASRSDTNPGAKWQELLAGNPEALVVVRRCHKVFSEPGSRAWIEFRDTWTSLYGQVREEAAS